MSVLKRQRELKKIEKAARKRARRHGQSLEPNPEPRPTVDISKMGGLDATSEEDEPAPAPAEKPAD